MLLKEKKKAFGLEIRSQSKVSESQKSSDKGRPLKKKKKKRPTCYPHSNRWDLAACKVAQV